MKQRHAYSKLRVHVVFKTWRRVALIDSSQKEQFLYRAFEGKVHELDVWLEGFGAWEDHVHAVVRYQPGLPVEKLVHDLKGVSAWLWNKEHKNDWGFLRWQDGYWAESICAAHAAAVAEYALRQREHHADKTTVTALEPE